MHPPPLLLRDAAATDRVGAALGHALQAGDTVLLWGTLGAGKSALARAAIRARCGLDIEVPSPTYTLVQAYEAPGLTLWHADLYRLGDPSEVPELGLEAAFAEDVVLVEWPERLGPWRPARALSVTLTPITMGADEGRQMTLSTEGPGWAGALAAMAAAA